MAISAFKHHSLAQVPYQSLPRWPVNVADKLAAIGGSNFAFRWTPNTRELGEVFGFIN